MGKGVSPVLRSVGCILPFRSFAGTAAFRGLVLPGVGPGRRRLTGPMGTAAARRMVVNAGLPAGRARVAIVQAESLIAALDVLAHDVGKESPLMGRDQAGAAMLFLGQHDPEGDGARRARRRARPLVGGRGHFVYISTHYDGYDGLNISPLRNPTARVPTAMGHTLLVEWS